MQVMEERGKNCPHLLRAGTSIAGEGSGRDMERPEGFPMTPRPEKGISQGILKSGVLFGNLNPFLRLWRLLVPQDAAADTLRAVRWGQRSRAPAGRTGLTGKG